MCVVLMLSVIRYSCYYFLDAILFHHDFHHDSCEQLMYFADQEFIDVFHGLVWFIYSRRNNSPLMSVFMVLSPMCKRNGMATLILKIH